MEELTLELVAAAIGATCNKQTEVLSICTDTRTIVPGSVFLALKGERFDGHDYAAQAAKAGAVAIICEHPVNGVKGIPVLQVKSTYGALLQIAKAYRNRFAVPVIAVTGSVGKTTTKEMIVAALSKKLSTMKTEGNLNNEVGLPKTLLRLNHTVEAAVVEMGMDHAGQIHNMSVAAEPTISVITNIGLCHIQNFDSQEGILKAKLEIVDGMDENAPVVLNGDDPFLSKAAVSLKNPALLYGIESETCDVRATNICEHENGISFEIQIASTEHRIPVTLPVYGIHHVYDALAAFSVGCLLQVPAELIAEGLSEYVPEGMRQHRVSASGITVVEDCYNASPAAVQASLSALKAMRGERKIAVLGDMLELGNHSEQGHRECGKAVAANEIPLLVAFGKDSAFTAEEAKKAGVETYWFAEKADAAAKLLELLKVGDTVLFKASHSIRMEDVLQQVYAKWPKSEKNEG